MYLVAFCSSVHCLYLPLSVLLAASTKAFFFAKLLMTSASLQSLPRPRWPWGALLIPWHHFLLPTCLVSQFPGCRFPSEHSGWPSSPFQGGRHRSQVSGSPLGGHPWVSSLPSSQTCCQLTGFCGSKHGSLYRFLFFFFCLPAPCLQGCWAYGS